jgi:hypothetical protein
MLVCGFIMEQRQPRAHPVAAECVWIARSDRSPPFFRYGLSDDGGRDEVDESLRACRSSSSTLAEPLNLPAQLSDQPVRLRQPHCQLSSRKTRQLLRGRHTSHTRP